MKRKVKLCENCVEMMSDNFPYLYPDGTPVKKEDLEIEVVDMSDCDNNSNNLDRPSVWVD
jgi:hypothetical protein